MSTQDQERRRRLVLAVTKRILDIPDDAPVEELKIALEAVGIDVDTAMLRTTQFVKDYPKRVLEEARARQETEQQAFERFQQQLDRAGVEQIKAQITAILEQLPLNMVPQMRSHYRELSGVTGDDVKSELVDLLWQLQKTVTS